MSSALAGADGRRMDPELWSRIEVILDGALDLQGADRKTFLSRATRGDEALRGRVEELLAVEEPALGFIEKPLFSVPADEGWGTNERDLEEGSLIGVYRVERRIGRGGMGAVYLARRDDQLFDKQVAIKVLRRGRDSEEIARRFRHERQILAQLDHPNIAKLLDGGTTSDGRPYFVMEYVNGIRIDHYCDKQKLSTRQRVGLFRKVCSAVSFAHQNLVIHRDLKPSNILVGDLGEPILLDFGIAKLIGGSGLEGPDPTLLTDPGSQPMTPRYASPEQVEGLPVTTGSDIYSLGVLLYELLTGHRAYLTPRASLQELREVVCGEQPEKPSSVVQKTVGDGEDPESGSTLTPFSVSSTRDGDPRILRRSLAGDLDSIVLKSLRKESHHRYLSVGELSEDLRRHLEGLPVLARQGELTYRGYQFLRRHRLALVTASAVLMSLLAVTLGVLRQEAVDAVAARDAALQQRDHALAVSDFLTKRFQLTMPQIDQGKTITARELLDEGREAIRDRRDFLRPSLEAPARGILGRAYLGLHLIEDAQEMLEENLALLDSGEEAARDRAQVMIDLVAVYLEQNETQRAEEMKKQALEILRSGQADDLRLATYMNNRAIRLRSAGEVALAEILFREAIDMKTRILGEDHLDVSEVQDNLAYLLERMGRFEEAEELYGSVLEAMEATYGRPSLEVAATLNSLAILYLNTERFPEGEAMARESLANRQAHGVTGADLEMARHSLATILRLQGKLDEAELLHRQAYESVVLDHGEGHRTVGFVLTALAATLEAAGRFEEAEATARQALGVFRKSFDADHWRIADASSVLGGTLLGQGKLEEAEPLIRRSLPTLSRFRGDRARATREARQRLEALEAALDSRE